MHLGKNEGFKGAKTVMSVKKVRFCKVCLRLQCVYRTAFYGRSKANNKFHEATYPGECVSLDQMECTQAGFAVQLKGRLTTKCYKAATIFVDHYSRLCFVHVMSLLTSKETIEAKQAFE